MATHKSLSSLARTMRGYANRVEKQSNSIVKGAAIKLGRDLAYWTPVDTGFARANWQAGLGVIPNIQMAPALKGRRNANQTGRHLGRGETRNLRLSSQNIRDVVSRRQPLGPPVYIVNNVPYVILLNDGSSMQSPAGFIEQSVARAVQYIRGRKLFGVEKPDLTEIIETATFNDDGVVTPL